MHSVLACGLAMAAAIGVVPVARGEVTSIPRGRLSSLRDGAPARALAALLGEPAAKAPGCIPGGPTALWLYPVSITLSTADRVVPAPRLRLEFDAAGVLVARFFVDGQSGEPLVGAETREHALRWLSRLEPQEGLPRLDVERDLVVGVTRRAEVDRMLASWRPQMPCGNGGKLPVALDRSAGERTVREYFVDRPSPIFMPAHVCLIAAVDDRGGIDHWWLQGWLALRPRRAIPASQLEETPAPEEPAERPLLHATAQWKGDDYGLLAAAMSCAGTRVAELRAVGGAWAPREALIAFIAPGDAGAGERSALRLSTLRGETRTLLTMTEGAVLVGPVAWSADGLRVSAFAVGLGREGQLQADVVVARVSDGIEEARVRMPDGVLSLPFITAPLDRVAWAPHGTALLASWESACVVELATRHVVRISEEPVVAEWSPDGEGLYYIGLRGAPQSRELSGLMYRALDAPAPLVVATGSELSLAGMCANRVFRPAVLRLSPSGSRMAIVTGSRETSGARLRIVEALPSGRMKLGGACQESPCARPVLDVEWSPDETLLAFLTLDEAGRVLVETFDTRTAAWNVVGPAGLDLTEMGTEGIDRLGSDRLLSWSR